MKDILSPAGLSHLRTFFVHRPLIVFDFDGTLAPIASRRDDVQASDLTRALVSRLSHWVSVGVVSGRRLSDLTDRFRGMDRILLAGNHGGESPEDGDAAYQERAAQAADDVRQFLADLGRQELLPAMPEHVVENKKLSLTFHWRDVDPELARKWAQGVRRIANESGNFRIIPGIQSLSVVPRDLSDKGDAVLGLLEAARCTHLVYLGDEETDEDVFRKAASDQFIGIRVGQSDTSAAEWYVASQAEVDRVLEVFLALVAGTATTAVAMTRPV